jgi:PiT family inorganic phosphate transporter
MEIALVLAALALAGANGANDNFKGVATLLGSGLASYRTALIWGSATTLLGGLAAGVLATGLLQTFSGRGIVPDELAQAPRFGMAVVCGAAGTVWLATRLGLPISTTHALVGGLFGAGLAADANGLNIGALAEKAFLPLLTSPLAAVALTASIYVGARCAGREPLRVDLAKSPAPARSPALDRLHFLSAGAVGFARGLNDAPKIAAALLVTGGLSSLSGAAVVTVAMTAGGLLCVRRVAETMARKVTPMTPSQGLIANLSTAALVATASVHGLPVSTTHVSVGSIVGVGASSGRANWPAVRAIAMSWIVTLPVATLFAALVYGALSLR